MWRDVAPLRNGAVMLVRPGGRGPGASRCWAHSGSKTHRSVAPGIRRQKTWPRRRGHGTRHPVSCGGGCCAVFSEMICCLVQPLVSRRPARTADAIGGYRVRLLALGTQRRPRFEGAPQWDTRPRCGARLSRRKTRFAAPKTAPTKRGTRAMARRVAWSTAASSESLTMNEAMQRITWPGTVNVRPRGQGRSSE